MAQQFGATKNPNDFHWVAWTCSLAPAALEDLAPAVELAEKAVAANAADQQSVTLGAILYRAGRFEEVVKHYTELTSQWESGRPMPTLTSPAYAWYYLAMAQHHLGLHDDAKVTLDRAVQWHDEKRRQHNAATETLDWNRILTLSLLRRQAEETLGPQPVPTSESQEL